MSIDTSTGPKTLKQWEEILMPIEVVALHDTYHTNPEEALTPNEVLDTIVEWHGGIATGYHVRSIISRVYGIELGCEIKPTTQKVPPQADIQAEIEETEEAEI